MHTGSSASRMNRIVERCPSCGVEHDEPTHECEACGSPVRFWCRTHSREIGWLESDVCPRCPPSAARPRPPKPVPPRTVAPTPAPPAGAAAASASRPYLRFDRAPAPAVEAPAAPPPAAPVPTPVAAAPMDPAVPVETSAAAPAAARKRGPGPVARVFDGVLTAMWWGIVFALAGIGAGALIAYFMNDDIPTIAAAGGAIAGAGGVILGALAAIGRATKSNPPER